MKESNKLRAVGYCRTSGEGQRDNTSIPTQKKSIENFCATNGWTVLRHYVDESKTGSTIAGRDAFQKMLKDAANGLFDVVVPYDVSRFSRDGVDILGNAKFLRTNWNVHVVDTKGSFDSRPGGNVLMNFLHAGVSEYERLKIMERMIGGRIHRAQNGLPWSGNRPFGRTFDKQTGKWYVNERGKRMRQMLERYAKGEGWVDLLKEFTEFSDARVVLTFIRESQLSGTYVKEFHIPEINIHHLQIPIPAIPEVISPELHARVKARMEHRRIWNQEHRRQYVLTGFVRCGHCGVALTGQSTGGRSYYRHCVYGNKVDCEFHSIRKEELVDPALDFLFSFFTDQTAFDAAVAAALPKQEDRENLVQEQKEVSSSLTRAQSQIAHLVDAIAAGVDPALLVAKQADLKRQCETLTARASAIETQLAEMPDAEALKQQAMAIRLQILGKVRQRDWRKLKDENIRQFLIFLFGENPSKLGNGITVFREQGRWRMAFKGKVEFHHDLSNGRPLLHAARKVAERYNEDAKRRIQQSVNLTRQT